MPTAADPFARVPLRRKYATRSPVGRLERRDSGSLLLRSRKALADVAGIDRGRMVVPCTISTEDEDRSGDIVVAGGILLEAHQANPVVLLEHGLEAGLTLPVGRAEDEGGRYTVRAEGKRLRAETHFSQSSLVAEQVFHLIAEDVLRGVSIGFIPYEQSERAGGGMLVRKCELFEYSHCAVPDNPYALADRIGGGRLCGKEIDGALLKSLSRHLPALRKQASGGWEGAKQQTAASAAPKPEEQLADYVPFAQEDEYEGCLPGAKALHSCHEALMAIDWTIEQDLRRQEDRGVIAFLGGLREELAGQVAVLREAFARHYPEHPPLSDDPTRIGKRKLLAGPALEKALDIGRWAGELAGLSGRLTATTKAWARRYAQQLRSLARSPGSYIDADRLPPLPASDEKRALLAERKRLQAELGRADARIRRVERQHVALREEMARAGLKAERRGFPRPEQTQE